jgi:hypothetical protein
VTGAYFMLSLRAHWYWTRCLPGLPRRVNARPYAYGALVSQFKRAVSTSSALVQNIAHIVDDLPAPTAARGHGLRQELSELQELLGMLISSI